MASKSARRPISVTRSSVPARPRPNALSGVIVMARSSMAGARAARKASGSSARSSVSKRISMAWSIPAAWRRSMVTAGGRIRATLSAGPDHLVGVRAEHERHAARRTGAGSRLVAATIRRCPRCTPSKTPSVMTAGPIGGSSSMPCAVTVPAPAGAPSPAADALRRQCRRPAACHRRTPPLGRRRGATATSRSSHGRSARRRRRPR